LLNFVLKSYFASITYFRKRKDPEPLTNGSGSWRPKNMRILRIRIPNTGLNLEQNYALRTSRPCL
jgi:hypothetical protein